MISNYKVFDIKDYELRDHAEYQEVKDSLDVFKRYKALASKAEIYQMDATEWKAIKMIYLTY